MSNEFNCEFISSNKAELLTCWKVNNSSIERIIHYRSSRNGVYKEIDFTHGEVYP